ncbi:splicing factor [Tanacetum coccineum]
MGVFVPNPLNYVGGGFKVVNDIQFEDKRIGDLFQVVTRLVLNPPKGLYYCLPGTTLTRGIRPLKIDKDMEAFIKVGYENGFKVELYIELYDYDVMGISNSDNLHRIDENINEPDYVGEEYDEDPENIDFHVEGEHDVVLEKLSDDLIDAKYKIQKGVRYPSYNPEADWDEFQLILSMKFENPLQLKNALADCGVKHGYQLWYYRSNYKSLFVYCGRGTKLGRCAGRRGINNKKKSVAEGDKVSGKKAEEASDKVNGKKEAEASDKVKGKKVAKDSPKNPDNGQNRFHRLYMCFKGMKDGWLSGCRKVIGIDGCFITHVCKGELLTVMGKDENNQMYLIAWVVVDVENTNNWCWFLSLLADDLQLEEGLGLTIILDSHKGLIEAVKTWLPQAEHGHYARHLYAKFKKKWTSLHYKRLFWGATTLTIKKDFTSKMREIRALDEGAYAFLMERDLATWCKADFQTATRCASYENGILESFNAQILSARGKPIITMLEDIIVCIMQRIWHMSKKASECDDIITPSIRNHLESYMDSVV